MHTEFFTKTDNLFHMRNEEIPPADNTTPDMPINTLIILLKSAKEVNFGGQEDHLEIALEI